ncbi:hypothetical protein Pcinc_031947 [Petrolisthes cinctipes]|uniref:Uncharacterized protein n=1 Tax=Petrolisthes cinctipes TaxID=88211 RepID=A0AAE1K438_PETCI|nr:hypothetical protein Pcinc_031947 [Petrolisthes cinctipes]
MARKRSIVGEASDTSTSKTTKKPNAEKKPNKKQKKEPSNSHKSEDKSINKGDKSDIKVVVETASEPTRNAQDELIFDGEPEFRPNMTPKEVLQAGSFGGTYFRPIKSSVTGESYTGVWKELPKDWLEGLNIGKQVASKVYDEKVNRYGAKCGGSLEMWEQSGWMHKQDPYGWFMWYCRYYQGRRTEDDERQIGRWKKCAGVKGRWRQNLVTKIVRSGCTYDNPGVSPVVRQTLLHWGYTLSEDDYKKGAKRVKL